MKNPDPTDLLAIALADIAKNGYSAHFLASLTLSLRTLKSLSLCRKPNVLAILYLLICLPYFLDGSAVLEKTDQRIRGVRAGENSNDHFSLQELQDAVLATLKKYWLHKYFLHIKDSEMRILNSAIVPHNSWFLVENLKENMQTLNIGLKMAQGKSVLQPETSQKDEKTEGKWTGLFSPQMDVNDSFMSMKEDVVTVHDDGEVSVEPVDAVVIDKTFQKYIDQPQFLESMILLRQNFSKCSESSKKYRLLLHKFIFICVSLGCINSVVSSSTFRTRLHFN